MTTASPLESVTSALLQAYRGGPAADDAALAPLVTDPSQAYAVQDAVVRALDADAGATAMRGYWKSGGPSRSQPLTHAALPAAGVRPAGSGTAGLHLRRPLIEAEVALRIGRDVTAPHAQALSQEDAAMLVDAMCVTIEVVDSRWASGRGAPALLKLADLQSHGALAVGAFVPYAPVDWSQQRCRVMIGTAPPQDFKGTHSLADPTWLLPAWLRHATRHGATVPAGTVVTTGTWCGMLEASAGDHVAVEFPGIGTASVQL
jgi:2-keto-4-pentenoate hydratase